MLLLQIFCIFVYCMMELKELNKNSKDIELVKQLYVEAFPKVERIPFDALLLLQERADIKFLGFYDENGQFKGLTYTYHHDDLSWLFYFAVMPSERGKGIGTKILQRLLEKYKDERLMIDIEDVDQPADNSLQRKKRYEFYKRMGFVDYGLRKKWPGITYNIMSCGGRVTSDEYDKIVNEFWDLLQLTGD